MGFLIEELNIWYNLKNLLSQNRMKPFEFAEAAGEKVCGIKVHTIPCYKDNYAYFIENEDPNDCILVDCCEFGPIKSFLEEKKPKCAIRSILQTHKH